MQWALSVAFKQNAYSYIQRKLFDATIEATGWNKDSFSSFWFLIIYLKLDVI